MKAHRALHELAEIVKTYQPSGWTFDSGGYAHFGASSIREFHELTEAFWALTGERPIAKDEDPLCVSHWDWRGWRIALFVYVDAPTGYEATA